MAYNTVKVQSRVDGGIAPILFQEGQSVCSMSAQNLAVL